MFSRLYPWAFWIGVAILLVAVAALYVPVRWTTEEFLTKWKDLVAVGGIIFAAFIGAAGINIAYTRQMRVEDTRIERHQHSRAFGLANALIAEIIELQFQIRNIRSDLEHHNKLPDAWMCEIPMMYSKFIEETHAFRSETIYETIRVYGIFFSMRVFINKFNGTAFQSEQKMEVDRYFDDLEERSERLMKVLQEEANYHRLKLLS